MSSFYLKSAVSLVIAITLAAFLQSCGSGDCAADKTVLVDYDADCIDDENDNCVLAENPAGGYNPEQFDGDEDGVGYPCDGNDGSSDAAGVFLVASPAFNMAGTYEFNGDCSGAFTATVRQNGDTTALTAFDSAFTGEAALEADGKTLSASFTDAGGSTCQLSVDALTSAAEIACTDDSGVLCRAQGVKTTTSLWSDLD